MNKRFIKITLVVALVLSMSFGVAPKIQAQESSGLKVFVGILPQSYFVKRIGGSHVSVNVLVGPGQSPATFQVTPKQMAELAQADVLFITGMPFENRLLLKISRSFKGLATVDLRKDIELRGFQDHDDGYEGHEGISDPHIWLDPKLAQTQAKTICDKLVRLDRSHAAVFRSNLREFQKELHRVDRKIASKLAPYRGRSIMVFHPAYGYFTDSYGLTQEAVEFEGKNPGPRQLASWIEKARTRNVKVVFVQPQFSKREAQTIAESVGAVVAPLDPLAPDYISNLEKMADAIVEGFQRKGE
jgi:zinc transport system substrate-binding protein